MIGVEKSQSPPGEATNEASGARRLEPSIIHGNDRSFPTPSPANPLQSCAPSKLFLRRQQQQQQPRQAEQIPQLVHPPFLSVDFQEEKQQRIPLARYSGESAEEPRAKKSTNSNSGRKKTISTISRVHSGSQVARASPAMLYETPSDPRCAYAMAEERADAALHPMSIHEISTTKSNAANMNTPVSLSQVKSKRKAGSHSKKSKEKDRIGFNTGGSVDSKNPALPSVVPNVAIASGSAASTTSSSASQAKSKSPFEKLNTLKLLLDAGHLSQEEYQERKTQIINEMTGTSTDRKGGKGNPSPKLKVKPKRMLQPIMKTVVPHQPPDFSRILKERAEKLSFDVDTLEWHSSPTRVKLDLIPFATGQLRNAYFLQDLGPFSTSHGAEAADATPPRLLVAKFSIRPAEPSSYLSDVEMQAVCAHYASLYNEHEPPLKVYYARSWLLKLRDRNDTVCSVEEYLPGAYVKYSNNNGYVGKETSTTEERERNTPQAFSHFTFVASDYRLMIVDIQGVNDSYTDPQIHTADGRGFGAGNLGTFGMEKFLATHRCNEVCRWLGLPSMNQQYKPGGTAAPNYKMPFGKVIKKSTNPITEERNTFSRSVTVSEAFGGNERLLMRDDDEVEEPNKRMGGRPYHGDSLVSTCTTSVSSQVPVYGKKAAHGANAHPLDEPVWWLTLKRLLCCCFGSIRNDR